MGNSVLKADKKIASYNTKQFPKAIKICTSKKVNTRSFTLWLTFEEYLRLKSKKRTTKKYRNQRCKF